jgi:hypothetical protein
MTIGLSLSPKSGRGGLAEDLLKYKFQQDAVAAVARPIALSTSVWI